MTDAHPEKSWDALMTPDDHQRRLIATVYDVFASRGEWPTVTYVEQTYMEPDAREVLASLPAIGEPGVGGGGQYRAVWTEAAGGALQPGARVGLTLVGLHLAKWPGVADCLLVLRRGAEHLDGWQPDPSSDDLPTISWSEFVGASPGLRSRWYLGNGPIVRSVLEHEPPTWGGIVLIGSDGDWSLRLSRRLRGLRAVESIEKYLDAVERLLSPPASSTANTTATPSAPAGSGAIDGPSIFLSYRRSDVQFVAGRLRDRLSAEFDEDNIFFDVDSIETGVDFRHAIEESLGRSDVVLVLIGPGWDPGRLEDVDDYVGFELRLALERDISMIPVLLAGAGMPPANDVPTDLRPIRSINAARLRNDPDFSVDASRLIERLRTMQ